MNPAARLGVSLVASLVLWFPTLQATMRGDTDLFSAAIRYLLAFGLATIAVNLLSQLVTGYAAEQAGDDESAAAEQASAFGRRREDVADSLAVAED